MQDIDNLVDTLLEQIESLVSLHSTWKTRHKIAILSQCVNYLALVNKILESESLQEDDAGD